MASALAFWTLNIGLALMVLLSVLPIGLMQVWASVEYGTWYARSAEFLHGPYMTPLKWMRVPGDVLFSVGALVLAYFVVGLVAGYSFDTERSYEREFAEEEALKAEACLRRLIAVEWERRSLRAAPFLYSGGSCKQSGVGLTNGKRIERHGPVSGPIDANPSSGTERNDAGSA